MVIRRVRRRLDHEHVLAAHVLLDLDEDLHVGEAAHRTSGEGELEIFSDRLGQRSVRIAGNEFHGLRHALPPEAPSASPGPALIYLRGGEQCWRSSFEASSTPIEAQ